MLNKVALMQ
ncbi:unnamed protein product [Allacma fusca]|uniref:Uncharacterized protein n=1 Tax=Allacma fusca TaxID=39272 RepID=A0A8J2PNS8_9HEXA|nr:unnamed protein product [Allacma fusca]